MNYQKSIDEGLSVEQEFANTLHKRKLFTRPATTEEQFQHIDIFWMKDGKQYSADIKSMKRRTRGGEFDPSIIWIEFSNVQGKPGWVYGKAQMIVFEQLTQYLIMDRWDVLNCAMEHIDMDLFADTPTVNESYRRSSRPKEHCGLMFTKDLIKYPYQTLKKG